MALGDGLFETNPPLTIKSSEYEVLDVGEQQIDATNPATNQEQQIEKTV
jgi:hypothetical protein